jgi:hypothetical protein
VLDGHQRRPAPLSTDAKPLQEAQGHEQDRGQHADGVEGGQQSYKERREAHDEQGENEHGLAADLVAVVAEDHAAYRPGHEGNPERGERGKGARQLAEAREEQRREDQRREDQRRRRPVQEKVVPLDGAADEAGRGDLGYGDPLAYVLTAESLHQPIFLVPRIVHIVASFRRRYAA